MPSKIKEGEMSSLSHVNWFRFTVLKTNLDLDNLTQIITNAVGGSALSRNES